MHEMMVIGEDFEAFDQGSNKSISLVSLDYDPAKLSEDDPEKKWSYQVAFTTLLFPSYQLELFEK
jgi:hypothetical protein